MCPTCTTAQGPRDQLALSFIPKKHMIPWAKTLKIFCFWERGGRKAGPGPRFIWPVLYFSRCCVPCMACNCSWEPPARKANWVSWRWLNCLWLSHLLCLVRKWEWVHLYTCSHVGHTGHQEWRLQCHTLSSNWRRTWGEGGVRLLRVVGGVHLGLGPKIVWHGLSTLETRMRNL